MRYDNPELPDGVNVSEKHPLRDFLGLAASVAVIAALLAVALALAAQWIAPRVPFEIESGMAARYAAQLKGGGAVQDYLQSLALRLASAQGLPRDLAVQVHYEDGPVVNAFASLGGHVVIYRGLIEAMPDENALAAVLAHEVAHVHHRHPAQALGRGLALGLVLSAASAAAGNSLAGRVMGEAGLLTALTFNRAQEEEADATALKSLAGVYGHVGGAEDLFRAMRKASTMPQPPRFLSTHPLDDDRVRRVAALAQRNGWARDGARTPIPEAVRAALAKPADKPAAKP